MIMNYHYHFNPIPWDRCKALHPQAFAQDSPTLPVTGNTMPEI